METNCLCLALSLSLSLEAPFDKRTSSVAGDVIRRSDVIRSPWLVAEGKMELERNKSQRTLACELATSLYSSIRRIAFRLEWVNKPTEPTFQCIARFSLLSLSLSPSLAANDASIRGGAPRFGGRSRSRSGAVKLLARLPLPVVRPSIRGRESETDNERDNRL